MRCLSSNLLLPVQGCLAIVALTVATLWPPASGAMLMVPLAGRDTNALARMALTGGALLLGPGPMPGSLVVMGQRSRIAHEIDGLDVVIIAAPAAGCRGGATSGA